ncbi:MAG: hypothetical protein JWP59_2258 [Massilia sp.]|nr:hypothetical protein [Massilia sp.]
MKIANLKIGQRLSLAFGIVLALLIVLTGVGVINMGLLNDATSALAKENWPKARLANIALDNARGSIARVFQLVATSDPAEVATAKERMGVNAKAIKESLDKLAPLLVKAEAKVMLADSNKLMQQYLASTEKVLGLLADGKDEQARSVAYGETYQALHKFAGTLRSQIDFQEKLFDDTAQASARTYASSRTNMLILGSAAVLLALIFAYIITRSITIPIRKAVAIAETVAKGDLTSHFEVNSTDETGQLLNALQEMNSSLVDIVGQVRSGTVSMASASSEIASGNLDLSSRTEQQASALEETASSMEEMTATVRQNAENARQANSLAASASQVAVKGGDVVSQVVETMGAINDSSRRIVDIIAVIDGIAFQTNILALNAAVEAARAGEQGRGFAVVAAEVRNLAQRSAAAAKEIKVLIGDSVEKVDFGSRLVDQAGNTMEEIVASVQSVTDIMSEISAASHEQESGIDQINRAIGEMDTVTQQNAALVEEAAAAAESLQGQSAHLADVVSVFKLQEGRVVASAAAARPARPANAVVGLKPLAVQKLAAVR